MKAIFKKELRALLGGLRGWGYAAIVLLGAAVSVIVTNLMGATTRFELNAVYIALSMIPATAIAATDAFHGERRNNTERILYSLPLKNTDIVIGKMLALIVPVLIAAAGLCIFPLLLLPFGMVHFGPALAVILALTVLGVAMMAAGLLMSACTPNRFAAAAATIAVLAASWAAPYLADMIAGTSQLTMVMMLAFMLVAFTATYLLSGSAYLGIAAAAVVEVPTLLAYLQGTGADYMQKLAGSVEALDLFAGLNPYVNGLLDGSALIGWLAVATLFTFAAVLCTANRRQAKRRAL